jgi:hypothetical protein
LSKLIPLEDRLGFEFAVWENITNERGEPRLNCARDFFFPLTRDKISVLVKCFRYWRDFDEYILLRGTNRDTREVCNVAVKCSKRGNDVYAKRLDLRLNFLSRLKDVSFFSPEDFKGKYGKTKDVDCNLLWVTLTWNSNLCSLHEAWKRSYWELHKFKANLENKYGKIEWLTFIQPFPDKEGEAYGYPHIHALILFKEASFSAFPRIEEDKEGKTVLRYRIREKYDVERQGKWHSFVDVQAISSVSKAVAYCKKYAESVMYGDSEKASLTCAMSWLYRKKSYTLTHGFQEAMNDLIVSLHVRKKVFQETLDGELLPIWDWQFLGIRSASCLDIECSDVWVKSLSNSEMDLILRGNS